MCYWILDFTFGDQIIWMKYWMDWGEISYITLEIGVVVTPEKAQLTLYQAKKLRKASLVHGIKISPVWHHSKFLLAGRQWRHKVVELPLHSKNCSRWSPLHIPSAPYSLKYKSWNKIKKPKFTLHSTALHLTNCSRRHPCSILSPGQQKSLKHTQHRLWSFNWVLGKTLRKHIYRNLA